MVFFGLTSKFSSWYFSRTSSACFPFVCFLLVYKYVEVHPRTIPVRKAGSMTLYDIKLPMFNLYSCLWKSVCLKRDILTLVTNVVEGNRR